MKIINEVRETLGPAWPGIIYRDRIRGQRTRSFSLDIKERENKAEILHTLLGIELKVGKRRFSCPDLATARYLRIFARLGCRSFAIPYDITKISPVADDLETNWQRALVLLENAAADFGDKKVKNAKSKLIKALRDEINEIGPGDAMPTFDRETRQRIS